MTHDPNDELLITYATLPKVPKKGVNALRYDADIKTIQTLRLAIEVGELRPFKFKNEKLNHFGEKAFLECCKQLSIDASQIGDFKVRREKEISKAINLLTANGYIVQRAPTPTN